jgi:hypothetical protein
MVIAWCWIVRATALSLLAVSWPDSTVADQLGPMNDASGSNDACSSTDPVDAAAARVYKQTYWTLQVLMGSSLVSEQLPPDPTFCSPLSARNFSASPDLQRRYRIEVAFAAMDYVQTNVSTALFAFEKHRPGFIVPVTAQEALSRGIGICGNHIAAFEAILQRLNVPVRSVRLWYVDANGVRQNHILTEVEWDNRWHLFDVTWGATYPGPDSTASHPDPMSIADVLTRKERPVWNPNNPTTRSIFAKGDDPFAYLDGDDLSVTIAEVGEVKVKPAELRGNTRVESFRDIPNYVGFNKPEARASGLSFLFDGLMGRFDVTVHVTAHNGCSTGGLVLDGVVVAVKDGVIQFRGVADPRRLSATSSDDVCYIVMKSVEFEPAAID